MNRRTPVPSGGGKPSVMLWIGVLVGTIGSVVIIFGPFFPGMVVAAVGLLVMSPECLDDFSWL